MMLFNLITAILCFHAAWCEAAAKNTRLKNSSTSTSIGSEAKCYSGLVNVPVEASNLKILYKGPENPMELTHFLQELRWSNSTAPGLITKGDRTNVNGRYDIFVKLCIPMAVSITAENLRTVQLLTHGATLSHNYWEMSTETSFIDAAARAGYATLAYDRLGVGLSEHPGPIDIVQSGVHVEVLAELARMLQNGLEGFAFKHVVGVGHSFGSWYTQTAAGKYPNRFDALVLTGTSPDISNDPVVHSALQPVVANSDPSGRFDGLPNGYLVQADALSIHQFIFFCYPHFDEETLLSQHRTRQTIALGELFTFSEVFGTTSWSGPLDIVNGVRDFVYCTGDCLYRKDVTASLASEFFPNVGSKFSSFNLPDTGHSLTGHYRAQEAYDHIFDFLQRHGLSGSVDTHSEL